MKYLPAGILAFEGLASFYKYFFGLAYFRSWADLVYGVLFLFLAYWASSHRADKYFPWLAVLLSFLLGPGGFLGLGGLCAIALAIAFFLNQPRPVKK